MTPAALIDEAAAAGVTLGLGLKVTAARQPDADLLAKLKQERETLVQHLLADRAEPDAEAPSRPDLRGVLLLIDDAGVSPWANGEPRPDAGPRLLSVLASCWPPDVVKTLANQHAADLLHLDAGEAFARLFCAAVDVTRQDRTPPP